MYDVRLLKQFITTNRGPERKEATAINPKLFFAFQPHLQRLEELAKACTDTPPRLRLCFKNICVELEQLEGLLL